MTDEPSVAPSRRRPRAAAFLVAGLVLLAFVPAVALAHSLPYAPAVGVARPASGPVVVEVNFSDSPSHGFDPSALSVPANATVDFHLNNTLGSEPHSFTLVNVSQSNVTLNTSWTPAQLDQYFATNGAQANVTVAPATDGWANLTFPSVSISRSFEFVSIVPYQFQAGYFGFLKFSASGPAQVLSENTTNQLSFVPSVLSVTPATPGTPVTVDVKVTNLGAIPHTFTVVAQSNVTIPTIDYFTTHTPLVAVNVPGSTNGFVWANFTVPAAGVYQYVCTITGHYTNGMFGYLYVGVPPPAVAPPPSTAIVEAGVLLGAFALLGVGVVLVAVSGLVGRFPKPPRTEGGSGHHGP